MPPSKTADRIAAAVAIGLGLLITVATWRSEDQNQYGYISDPEGASLYAASLPKPTYAEAVPEAMAKTVPVDTFLWRPANAAHIERYGVPFTCSNQKNVGSCVAHGAAHCVYIAACVAWARGERDEPPLLVHQGCLYGGARVEARGKDGSGTNPVGGYRDGATGWGAAKFLRDFGVVWKKNYPSRDCTTSGVEIEKEMGAFGCGGRGDDGRMDAEAKKVPCHYVAQVKTYDELIAALTSGTPVTLASTQGFRRTLNADSVAEPSGTWHHQMVAVGYRTDIPAVAIMNSWGDYITYTAPRWPADLPDGTFWAERDVVSRMLAQGDCWAISDVAFKYKPINNSDWMDNE